MTAVKPLPPHGSNARYCRDCRCLACCDAHNSAKRRRYRLKGYGQWQPFTDAEPVRTHLRTLMAADTGWRQISTLANLHPSVIKFILYGRDGREMKKVRTETAEKILAVQVPDWRTAPDNATVPNVGTRRRIEALGCHGFSCTRIAKELGAWPETVRTWLRNDRIEARHARAVAELYSRWEMSNAEANGSTFQSASCARALAKRRGWQPPMAWDPETIDDPDAQPTQWERVDTGRRTSEELAAEGEEIRSTCGLSWDLIAERLGVSRTRLDKARERVAARIKQAEQELAA